MPGRAGTGDTGTLTSSNLASGESRVEPGEFTNIAPHERLRPAADRRPNRAWYTRSAPARGPVEKDTFQDLQCDGSHDTLSAYPVIST